MLVAAWLAIHYAGRGGESAEISRKLESVIADLARVDRAKADEMRGELAKGHAHA